MLVIIIFLATNFNVSILQSQNKPLKLTQPKPPQLHTAMRVRPPRFAFATQHWWTEIIL